MEDCIPLVLSVQHSRAWTRAEITQRKPGNLWAGGLTPPQHPEVSHRRGYSTGVGQTQKNGKIQCAWIQDGEGWWGVGCLKKKTPPPVEFCEQSPSTSCNAAFRPLSSLCIWWGCSGFFFGLPKTKGWPPAEFLCRGWALSELSPSPSEAPGRLSASRRLPVCSPVRFHPLAQTTPLILFPLDVAPLQ